MSEAPRVRETLLGGSCFGCGLSAVLALPLWALLAILVAQAAEDGIPWWRRAGESGFLAAGLLVGMILFGVALLLVIRGAGRVLDQVRQSRQERRYRRALEGEGSPVPPAGPPGSAGQGTPARPAVVDEGSNRPA